MSSSPADFALASSAGFVAFTFIWSGIAKFGRTAETVEAMKALHVPKLMAQRSTAILLPLWEIALALGLLTTAGTLRMLFVCLTIVTLGMFTIYLVNALRRGDEVTCGCFGGLSQSGRVNALSVTRNAVLIGLTLVVAAFALSNLSALTLISTRGSLFALAVVLSWSVAANIVFATVLTRHGRDKTIVPRSDVELQHPTAGMGDPIPDVEVVSENGTTVPLTRLGRGYPVLLVFLSAECSSCVEVAHQIPQWQADSDPILIRILTSSRPDDIRARFPEAAPFARYGGGSAKHALGVLGGPAGVLLGNSEHPVIASPVVYGMEGISALLKSATRSS